MKNKCISLSEKYDIDIITNVINQDEELKQLFKRYLRYLGLPKGTNKTLVNQTIGWNKLLRQIHLSHFEKWLEDFDKQNLMIAKYILEHELLTGEENILEICSSTEYNITKSLRQLTKDQRFVNAQFLISGSAADQDFNTPLLNHELELLLPAQTLIAFGIYKDLNALALTKLNTGNLLLGTISDRENKNNFFTCFNNQIDTMRYLNGRLIGAHEKIIDTIPSEEHEKIIRMIKTTGKQ